MNARQKGVMARSKRKVKRPITLAGRTRVFVYGTLKRGYHNSYFFLQTASLVGEATTIESFFLADGGFPYAHNSPSLHPVRGEVWLVDAETLRRLDQLEGVPTHYQRIKTKVIVDGEVVVANMYTTDREPHPHRPACPVIDGAYVWGEHDDREVA